MTASSGASLLMIGRLLGHKDTATTAKYAHLLEDPVRETADRAAQTLSTWLDKHEESARDGKSVRIA